MTESVSQPMTSQAQVDDDEIDLVELFGLLLDHKWLIGALTVIATLIGGVFAKSQPQVFRAEAMIQIESREAGIPGLSDIEGLFTIESEAVTEIELIKSRRVIGEVVDTLQLDIQVEPRVLPLFAGLYQARNRADALAEPLVGLGKTGFAFGGEILEIGRLDVADRLLDRSMTLIAGNDGAYELWLGDSLALTGQVGEPVSSDQISLFVRQMRARPGTEFTVRKSRSLRVINGVSSALSVSEKGKQSGIVTVAYESENPEAAKALVAAVTETYVRQNVNRNTAEVTGSLEFLQSRLPEVEASLKNAEDRFNAYQTSQKSVDIRAETQVLLDQLVSLEERLAELELEEMQLLRRFKPNHPTYEAFTEKKREIENRRDQFQADIQNLPETQQELLRLRRDVEVNTQIYTQMLNSVQELNILRAGTLGNVRIIDPAEVNDYQPVKPRVGLIVALAALLGGVGAVGLVLVRAALRRAIERPDEIERLGLPVLAAIPFSKIQESVFAKRSDLGGMRSKLLALASPKDVAVEALRNVRTSLHFAMVESANNRIMVTGASPGVGKTFVSVNLGVTLAESGKRVVVVDADLRKGTLNKYFDLKGARGLSDYLIGDSDLNGVVQTTAVEGLSVIGAGTFPPNPSELLMSARFQTLLTELSESFDLVLLDTPPVMAVTDALLVGRYCGTSLLVVRYGVNSVKEIEVTGNTLGRADITINGVVFNAIKKSRRGYGYGYGYGYAYGKYQYAYGQDKKS